MPIWTIRESPVLCHEIQNALAKKSPRPEDFFTIESGSTPAGRCHVWSDAPAPSDAVAVTLHKQMAKKRASATLRLFWLTRAWPAWKSERDGFLNTKAQRSTEERIDDAWEGM